MGTPEKTILGITRKDLTGTIQKYREKRNISYRLKDGREVFAKYAKKQSEDFRDNVEGMEQEARVLKKLEILGITPKVIDFKISPDSKISRLVTDKVPGTSLDRLDIPEERRDTFIETTIVSSAKSLSRINAEGVYVVDINTGTFLVNENGEDCRVVDLEHAVDSDATSDKQITDALQFRNLRFEKLGIETPNSIESVRKKEMYAWAKTMLEFISKNFGNIDIINMEISLEELPSELKIILEQEIKTATEKLLPSIREKVTAMLKTERYQEMLKKHYSHHWGKSLKTFDDYFAEQVDKEVGLGLKKALNFITLKHTLKYKLEKLGLKLPEQIVSFLEKCLDVNPNNRPDSFNDIL